MPPKPSATSWLRSRPCGPGALIGYVRVSTSGQLLDRQQHALAEAGCLRVFADKLSGRDAERPELAACLDYLRPGNTLVVPSLDRLSRSLSDLIAISLRRQFVLPPGEVLELGLTFLARSNDNILQVEAKVAPPISGQRPPG